MTLHRTIDYSEFDGLMAERAMLDMGMNERHVAILRAMLEQGASPDDLTARMLRKYPGWEGRANALREIVIYLSNGRRAEE